MMTPIAASLIAPMASSMIQSVASSFIKAITEKKKKRKGRLLPLLGLLLMMRVLIKGVISATR